MTDADRILNLPERRASIQESLRAGVNPKFLCQWTRDRSLILFSGADTLVLPRTKAKDG